MRQLNAAVKSQLSSVWNSIEHGSQPAKKKSPVCDRFSGHNFWPRLYEPGNRRETVDDRSVTDGRPWLRSRGVKCPCFVVSRSAPCIKVSRMSDSCTQTDVDTEQCWRRTWRSRRVAKRKNPRRQAVDFHSRGTHWLFDSTGEQEYCFVRIFYGRTWYIYPGLCLSVRLKSRTNRDIV